MVSESDINDLLEAPAPCLFCSYNGHGYWQRGTHHKQCPWNAIGGEAERAENLPDLTRKLFYINASPCDPDITDKQIDAYSGYQQALSAVRNFDC